MWDFVKRALTNEYIEVLREQQMARKIIKAPLGTMGLFLCYAFMS